MSITGPSSDNPSSAEPVLTVTLLGKVAVLTLNRPRVRNALSAELVESLAVSLHELEQAEGVGAVVLRGTPPGFCSGSDIKELRDLGVDEVAEHEAAAGAVARAFARSRLPVLAAVEGFAIGGGFCLASACDVVTSARGARWQLPEVSLGWLPPWGLSAVIARTGLGMARQLAWGWQALDGTDAYHYGLADSVTEDGKAFDLALRTANDLTAMPGHSVAAVKNFFAPLIMRHGETLDNDATRTFRHNFAVQMERRGRS